MGLTLLTREMFATTGTLTSGSPGSNFSVVTGTLYQRAGGPRVGAGAAARVDVHNQSFAGGQFSMADSSMPKLFTGAWFYFKSIETISQSYIIDILDAGGGNDVITLTAQSGNVGANVMGQFWTACPVNPVNRWLFLGIGVSKVSGSSVDIKYYYKTLGGALTVWLDLPGFNPAWWNTTMGFVKYGAFWGQVSNFCFGAPSVYTFANADFSDVIYPADLIEPVTRLSWYVNPATGNDNNDGVSAGNAWATAGKVNAESQYCGIFPAPTYSSGDVLIIDTSSADLDITAGGLMLQTSGLKVQGVNGTINTKAWKVIVPGDWTSVGGGVYSTTNTSADSVVWEDDKWMNHPNGANYAAVSSALASTPGSFWTDGTTMYVHPFGNTDPRSDGKVYTRSCFGGGAAVILLGSDMDVWDLVVKKTCDVQPNGVSNGGYCISTSGGFFGGLARIKNCRMFYGGKHGLGFTNDASNSDITIEDCQAEQCSPYSSQSCWVAYMAGPSETGNIQRYVRCLTNKVSGLIGSSGGKDDIQSCFFCHNNGSGEQFAEFQFIDCNFPRSEISAGLAPLFTIMGCLLGAVAAYSPTINIDRCLINGRGVGVLNETAHVTIRNCIIQPDVPFSGGANEGWSLKGIVTIEGCTFDLVRIPGGTTYPILWIRGPSPMTLAFKNNIVIGDGRFAVMRYGSSADTLTFTTNAYNGMPDGYVALYYDNGAGQVNFTLPQWKAIGKDVGTIAPADLWLDGNLRPRQGSPVIDAGGNLGEREDYSGETFNPRNDIGAYEYVAMGGGGYPRRAR